MKHTGPWVVDARLSALAPELLAAAKEVLRTWPMPTSCPCKKCQAVKKLESVIKKVSDMERSEP